MFEKDRFGRIEDAVLQLGRGLRREPPGTPRSVFFLTFRRRHRGALHLLIHLLNLAF
jgi:hypothetical protein